MNYRFQKIATVYPEFGAQFGERVPNHQNLSYLELYEKFIEEHDGWSDYYRRRLQALGNESQEIFASLEPLQKAWAREHGERYSQRGWLKEIVLAQVKAFQPDVIFLQDLYIFDGAFRQLLRDRLGRRVVIIGFRSAPTDDYAIFKDLDLVLSCIPGFVNAMRESGVRAEILMHAFEPSILEALGPKTARDLDFTFVGSLIRQDGFHGQRFELVEKLLAATPLEVWGRVTENKSPGRRPQVLARAASYASRAIGGAGLSQALRDTLRAVLPQQTSPVSSLEASFPAAFHEPVFGLANFRVLARSKLTFNNHIDCVGDYAGNVRLFEATGAGACLITDQKENLSELFEPDVEVVAYKSAEECIEKVKYLLDRPSEHEAIGAAGQRRTLRDHTFAHRAEELDSLIRKLL
jgi:spore maturation protein CgeB